MKIPNTYSEWMNCFDIVKEGTHDFEILEYMKKGNLTLSAGVAGRFATQLSSTIQYRMKYATEKFNSIMQRSGSDITLFSSALITLRKDFIFLLQIANIPVLGKEDTELLVNAIKEQASSIQKNLESSSAKLDRTGILTSIIKKNNIDKLDG